MMRIVVVDDEPELRELVRHVPEDEGYEVLSFAHPVPVTTLNQTDEHPDLFLIDIMLPDINGIALAARLQDEGFPTIPKIAMSASRELLHVAQDSHLFAATVSKPFELDDLLGAVEQHLAGEHRSADGPGQGALEVPGKCPSERKRTGAQVAQDVLSGTAGKQRADRSSRKWRLSMRTLITKLRKDNIGALAAIVSWNVLTSVVAIVVSLLAISGFVLRGNPSTQHAVIAHLSQALKGVITPSDLTTMVNVTVNHAGLLGVVGLLGALWGGSNVGGAISTVFQPIFEVKGRNFIVEKLIDVGMIFVIAALMVVIVVGTTAGSVVDQLVSGLPFSSLAVTVIGTLISVVAAFLLFGAIYLVFPNIEHRFRLSNVRWGALVAAVLFVALTFIWPAYAHFAHFGRYGAVLFPILLLTAWIYCFSLILILGAEIVATGALRRAEQAHQAIGPAPDGTVPQHVVLRDLDAEGDLEVERRAATRS